MAISSPGIGSGLDVNGIITKLMSVESQPLTDFDTKEAGIQAKISALGSLKGALSSLQSTASSMLPATGQTAVDRFSSYQASVADTTVGTASAASGAVTGSYNLNVTSVAQSHQLKSSPYAASTTVVGTGTIVIERGSVDGGVGSSGAFTAKSGTNPITITIDDTNNTLAGIRDAINSANAGVSATIVSGSGSAYLMLTSNSTGTQDAMKITGNLVDVDSNPLPDINYDPSTDTGNLTTTQLPTDAVLTINSIPVTSTSNTITDAISGVTLNLSPNAKIPAATTLTVSKDTSSSLTSVFNALAKAFNGLSKTIHDLGNYDASTKQAGPLLGNSTLRTAQSQINKVLGDIPVGATGTYQRLAQLGVTIQRDGTMAVDSTKLQTAIGTDYNSVAALAASLGKALNSAANSLVNTGGILDSATNGLNATVKDIDKRRTQFQQRLVSIEARYRKQFTALDSTIAAMNSTSSYLQQQLASLSQLKTSSSTTSG